MPRRTTLDPGFTSAPFDRLRSIQRLGTERSGHASIEHVRHQLYVAHDTQSRTDVLIKVATKPGLVYQQNLTNEIAILTTINRELPESRFFPLLWEHGDLRDGRVFLIMSLFGEWPLATTIGPERMPARLVAHLRTCLEVARALDALHGRRIFHVDLNPMNILYRSETAAPVVRIVDFESAYEVARHSTGTFYDPPTTSGFSAPELRTQAPDARADVYSLGAVLYTLLAGYGWSWQSELWEVVEADAEVDADLKSIIRTAVEPEPDRRFATSQDLRVALAGYLESIWPGRS